MGILFAFNYFVDPYGRNNILKIKGFNFYKSRIDERILKFENMLLEDYDSYIFGSSKVTVMDPDIIQKLTQEKAYNVAFSSATTDEYYKYIDYLIKRNKNIKSIFIGIDLFAFSNSFKSYGHMPKNFNKTNEFNTIYENFSLQTLLKSFSVVLFNINNKKPDLIYNNKGMRIYQNYLQVLNNKGMKYENYIDNNVAAGKVEWHKIDEVSRTKINYLKTIKKLCDKNDIKLYLFTNPFYIQYLNKENSKEIKLYKELIHEIVKDISPLIDYNLKPTNINQETKNFIDKSHYNYITADLILNEIIRKEYKYGTSLTLENIESYMNE